MLYYTRSSSSSSSLSSSSVVMVVVIVIVIITYCHGNYLFPSWTDFTWFFWVVSTLRTIGNCSIWIALSIDEIMAFKALWNLHQCARIPSSKELPFVNNGINKSIKVPFRYHCLLFFYICERCLLFQMLHSQDRHFKNAFKKLYSFVQYIHPFDSGSGIYQSFICMAFICYLSL